MALKAVDMGNYAPVRLGAADWDLLQWEQFQHDEKYHREIARLTVQDRLKHMALHIAKYAGGLAEVGDDSDRAARLATDTFIIAMSTANILNVRLADRLDEFDRPRGEVSFATVVVILAGRMAAACEKMDHLEAYPFRERITEAVLQLLAECLAWLDGLGFDWLMLVDRRLQSAKEKSIFYGKL